MSAHLRPLSLAIAFALLASTSACAGSYRARQAPLGDPIWPAAHTDGVMIGKSWKTPGWYVADGKGSRDLMARVTRGGFEVEGGVPEFEGGVQWDVHLEGGTGTDVISMMWSPPTAPRCQAGHPALGILLDLAAPPNNALAPDRQIHWERPVVVRGPRVISARFDEDPELLEHDSVVDLEVIRRDAGATTPTCVRVPITGAGVSYWSDKRWSLGVRVSFRRALAFTPSSTLNLGLSFGRWLGPVRLSLEGVIGGTDDPSRSGRAGTLYCFAAMGPGCDGVNLAGVSLEANGIGWRLSRKSVVGWSLAYEALFAGLKSYKPDGTIYSRDASSGGLRFALQWLRSRTDVVGVAPRSPTSAAGAELFVAASQEWTGAANGHHVTFGVSALAF